MAWEVILEHLMWEEVVELLLTPVEEGLWPRSILFKLSLRGPCVSK